MRVEKEVKDDAVQEEQLSLVDDPTSERVESSKKKNTTHKRRKMRRPVAAKRTRTATPAFPAVPFTSGLSFAQAVQEHGAGQAVRRLTLFDKVNRSPESSSSRDWITHAGKYGLTKGSYKADSIELTELGAVATSPDSNPTAQLSARFKLAIENVPVFKALYDRNKGNRLASREVLADSLAEANVPEEQRTQAVDVFLTNAKDLGLVRSVAGAERIIPIEQALEDPPGRGFAPTNPDAAAQAGIEKITDNKSKKDWKTTCFVIAPIGDDGHVHRKHSDMVLEQFIRKALDPKEWTVVRADEITSPGMISGQVIEHVMRSGLVIADLSFHNPNVFYELAIRHVMGLPTVHLIRKGDAIPFDLKDFRTITIDTSDTYDLVTKLDGYRADIASYTMQTVADGPEAMNPIRLHAKGLKVTLD